MSVGDRVAVIGVGGIGAWYVARLAEAGAPVLAVARGEHLRALRAGGLRVDHPARPFRGAVDAVDLETLCGQDPAAFGAVILLTKATATGDVATRLAGWLEGAPATVLSLQNGVDNEAVLEAALGRGRVLGGYSVRLGGHVVAPGHVACVGECLTCIGAWPDDASAPPATVTGARELAGRLHAAGIATEVFDDIRREMWRKLVLNAGVNPLSALLGWDTRRLSHDPMVAPLVRAIMDETVRAGRADGVAVTGEDAQAMFDLIRDFPAIRTSMLVDVDRGREPEVDAICGAVLRRAAAQGGEAPVLDTVSRLLAANLAAGPQDA